MRHLWVLMVVLFVLVMPAQAQEGAVVRFYIVPVEQVGIYRGPEYLRWRFDQSPIPELAGVRWSCKDYGIAPQMVCAADVTPAQHLILAAFPDVWAWAENLDTPLGSINRNLLNTFLEAVDIPADWLSPQNTQREALRTITGMFLYMQRLFALTGANLLSTYALNTRLGNMTAQWQAAIQQAGTDLGYDTAWMTGNMTVRIILKNMANRWGTRVIHFDIIDL